MNKSSTKEESKKSKGNNINKKKILGYLGLGALALVTLSALVTSVVILALMFHPSILIMLVLGFVGSYLFCQVCYDIKKKLEEEPESGNKIVSTVSTVMKFVIGSVAFALLALVAPSLALLPAILLLFFSVSLCVRLFDLYVEFMPEKQDKKANNDEQQDVASPITNEIECAHVESLSENEQQDVTSPITKADNGKQQDAVSPIINEEIKIGCVEPLSEHEPVITV